MIDISEKRDVNTYTSDLMVQILTDSIQYYIQVFHFLEIKLVLLYLSKTTNKRSKHRNNIYIIQRSNCKIQIDKLITTSGFLLIDI